MYIILIAWLVGAFLLSHTTMIKSIEAYLIAQTEYNVKLIQFSIRFLILVFWIPLFFYLLYSILTHRKANILEDGYPLEEQVSDRLYADYLKGKFDEGEILDAEFEIVDEDPSEKIFQERAKNIENAMDPNVRWEVGPGGEIRKKSL